MLINLIKLVSLSLFIYLVYKLIGIPIMILVDKIFSILINWLGNFNNRITKKNTQKYNVSKGSNFYTGKYYKLTHKMLVDLRISTLSVEAFTSSLTIITVIINFWILSITRSIFLFFLFSVSFYILMYTIMFMFAVQFDNKFTLAILDAEDTIISTVKNGFVGSVRSNILGVPKLVRPHFENFLDNIDKDRLTYEESLTNLYNSLGPRFEPMFRIALPYENNSYSGAESEFIEVTRINTKLRTTMAELSKHMKKGLTEFSACVIAIFVTAVLMLAGIDNIVYKMFCTMVGQFTLGVNILLIVCGFCYIVLNGQGLRTHRGEL